MDLTMLAAESTGLGLGAGLAALGAGLGIVGAGYGISRIASASVESMARQPQATGDIRGAMILTAALIEGVALFGVAAGFMAQMGLVGQIAELIKKP
jgi:F-type H+-transporting ATPase subunit c